MEETLCSTSLVVFTQKPIHMVENLTMLEMKGYLLHTMQQMHTMATFLPLLWHVFIIILSLACFRLFVLNLPLLNQFIIFNWQMICVKMYWMTCPVNAESLFTIRNFFWQKYILPYKSMLLLWLVLILITFGIPSSKSVISHVANSKYLKSSKCFGINFMPTDKLSIGE